MSTPQEALLKLARQVIAKEQCVSHAIQIELGTGVLALSAELTAECNSNAASLKSANNRWIAAQERLSEIESALQSAAGVEDRGSLDCIEELSRQLATERDRLHFAELCHVRR